MLEFTSRCLLEACILAKRTSPHRYFVDSPQVSEKFQRTPVKKCFYPLTVIVDALQNFCDVFHCVAHKLCHITLREVTCR